MLSQPAIEALVQISAGGTAGFVEAGLMHPLDLVKTRLQLQRSFSDATKALTKDEFYFGVFDCLRKMYKNEGFVAYWKGLCPPLMAETPKRAIKFFTFEQYKSVYSQIPFAQANMPVVFAFSGLTAGLTEAAFVNPFEVVKIRLQTDLSPNPKLVESTWSVTKDIFLNEGVRGFMKGLSATMYRNGIFNMVYFGFYHSIKPLIPEPETKIVQFLKKLTVAFASGSLAATMNIPFDVVKSRIQGPQPVPDIVKFKSTWATFRIIYREEGVRAFYKGLLPKIMRLGPGGAIMLVVYDYTLELYGRQFCR